MGKKVKQTAAKVEVAPAADVAPAVDVAPPVPSAKKGKRDVQKGAPKQAVPKKQKKAEKEEVVPNVVSEEVEKEPTPEPAENGNEAIETENEEPSVEEKEKPASPVKEAEATDEEGSDDEGSGGDASDDEDAESDDDKKPEVTKEKPKAEVNESATVFLGNLSYKVERSDVEKFFKDVGEIVDVRFASDHGRMKGFGHVEFATVEAAKKAVELNGESFMDRAVKIDLAKARSSNQSDAAVTTVFIKGFSTSDEEDEIKSSLQDLFGSCGEITRISIPVERDTGSLRGMAYVEFADSESANKALELDGSMLGDSPLTVSPANQRSSGGGRGGGGRGGGGRFGGGGRRGGGGRFGGGGGRGRFGGGGGRGGGGGGRGRGGRGGRGRF